MTAVVQLRGLTKHFGGRRALGPLHLALEGSQLVGVVGPDGAGKTTLLRSIAGLLEIEAEEALVLGRDLRGDVRGLKAALGYVPQSFSLQRELSVRENLVFTARLHGLPAADFERRASEMLERTGLAPFRDRPAGALSGGMKQKLAVANALLPEPALLILDEPTAGVDVLARAEIWSLLEAHARDALVLISTSYLEEAAASDRLLYLDDGRVVANGTPEQLRAGAGLDLYRVWAASPREVAEAARRLPFVASARPSGPFARIEVARDAHAGGAVIEALAALPGALLAEATPPDMEAALFALSRGPTGGRPS